MDALANKGPGPSLRDRQNLNRKSVLSFEFRIQFSDPRFQIQIQFQNSVFRFQFSVSRSFQIRREHLDPKLLGGGTWSKTSEVCNCLPKRTGPPTGDRTD